MEINWKAIGFLLVVCVICVGAEWLIISGVDAEEMNITNGSYVIVEYPNETLTDVAAVVHDHGGRIQQGDCVEIGKTYDISGIGWWTGYIAYYGKYNDDFAPGNSSIKYIIEIPSAITKLKEYYIDPDIYTDNTGYWFGYYGYTPEIAANNRLFRVSEYCPLPQGYINVTPKKKNATELIALAPLPPRYANADVVLARGDTISIRTTTPARLWVFGREDQILDRAVTSDYVTFNASDFINSEVGFYDVALITPGNNSIFEESYNPEYKPEKYSNYTYPAIVSPFVSGKVVNIDGTQPRLVFEQLKEYVAGTIDDGIKLRTIEFQEPDIQIARIDASILDENKTYLTVRGYTNVREKTPITLTLDAYTINGVTYEENTFTTYATGYNGHEWRQFTTTFPVDFGMRFPGQHYITATTETGASAIVPFYIRKELPAHYIPPTYIEFVDNSPFIPPTFINTTVTVEVTKEVIKTVTVVETLDYQKLAAEDIRQLSIPVIGGLIVLIVGIYLVYAGIRAHERRKGKFD